MYSRILRMEFMTGSDNLPIDLFKVQTDCKYIAYKSAYNQ